MSGNISRRDFLGKTTCGAVALFGLTDTAIADNLQNAYGEASGASLVSPEFPRQEMDAVREIVGAAHARFDRVKELVTARSALAKASWDWGFGDWESPLGAASHMGQREIAEFLMEHGARPNIFTFAMLGKLDAVRSMVEAIPGIQRIPGPHGITLAQHARNRLARNGISEEDREMGEKTVAYLESLGDADTVAMSLDMTDEQKHRYLGRYTFGSGTENELVVALNSNGRLTIKRGDQASRTINLVESDAFAPAGAPAVRIRFEVFGDQAVSLTVHDPAPRIKATRIAG